MPYDYTDAPPPQFELIPHGTSATVVLHIRPGNIGEDEMLKRSKDGGCEMLDVEFTVFDGPYKGRKFWENLIMAGTTDGHAQSVEINRGTLKAILDSALGLKPDDKSPEARKARNVSYKQFEGVTFIAKIGIEKGKPKKNDASGETWPDKNILAGVITPDKKDWHPVEQPPPFNGGGAAAAAAPSAPAAGAAPIKRPKWSETTAS
jgi:hypothetical protein